MAFEKKPLVVESTTPAKEEAPKESIYSYFRVKKLSNWRYQVLEVEVDENQVTPFKEGKEDVKELVLDRLVNLVCPHIDFKRKKNRI